MSKVYIAGPMRGYKNFNVESFDSAEGCLRALGFDVFNPARFDRDRYGDAVMVSETGDVADVEHLGFNLAETLAHDIRVILTECDGIVMLSGWEGSKGATAEHAAAAAAGKDVYTFDGACLYLGDHCLTCEAAMVYESQPDSKRPTANASGEVRTVSSTGGEKGVKPERFDLIPAVFVKELAHHYGRGAAKYEDRNWERGYEWSKSYGALNRHLWAFWNGEDYDEETGSPHIVAVGWHASVLTQFLLDPARYGTFDDRPMPVVLSA